MSWKLEVRSSCWRWSFVVWYLPYFKFILLARFKFWCGRFTIKATDQTIHCLYARYFSPFKFDKNNLEDSYINIVKYTKQCFNIIKVEPLDIWAKLRQLKSKENLILQIFATWIMSLCSLINSSAQLKRFFNHMKHAKSDIGSSLTQLNLSSLLKITMLPGEISVSYFNSPLFIRCV